jgi:hypothetical protein
MGASSAILEKSFLNKLSPVGRKVAQSGHSGWQSFLPLPVRTFQSQLLRLGFGKPSFCAHLSKSEVKDHPSFVKLYFVEQTLAARKTGKVLKEAERPTTPILHRMLSLEAMYV